jgi:hypothetical protein
VTPFKLEAHLAKVLFYDGRKAISLPTLLSFLKNRNPAKRSQKLFCAQVQEN